MVVARMVVVQGAIIRFELFDSRAASSFVTALVDGTVFIDSRKMWPQEAIHDKAHDADQKGEEKGREEVDRCQCPGQRSWTDQCYKKHEKAKSNCVLK